MAAGAQNSSSTLRNAVLAAQAAVNSPSFSKGRIIVSQSGSGQSGSYQMSGSGYAWTPENVLGICEEILMMLDIAAAQVPDVLPDDGVPAHTEALRASLAANFMAGNVPDALSVVQGDFTLLFIPVFGTGLTT